MGQIRRREIEAGGTFDPKRRQKTVSRDEKSNKRRFEIPAPSLIPNGRASMDRETKRYLSPRSIRVSDPVERLSSTRQRKMLP